MLQARMSQLRSGAAVKVAFWYGAGTSSSSSSSSVDHAALHGQWQEVKGGEDKVVDDMVAVMAERTRHRPRLLEPPNVQRWLRAGVLVRGVEDVWDEVEMARWAPLPPP
uniref:Uncharacterized protein n=1 Tax=Chlamydomonas leiostraca TaxID=1034604 RepID=A0A7S0R5A7_9CHLO|mmetsp:Transcript_14021/g.34581  ORF Transcript_14021/g.34581 Transcript_14021/m.34581 type:complete len:109 (+) Transcript_14021:819-1145(+)